MSRVIIVMTIALVLSLCSIPNKWRHTEGKIHSTKGYSLLDAFEEPVTMNFDISFPAGDYKIHVMVLNNLTQINEDDQASVIDHTFHNNAVVSIPLATSKDTDCIVEMQFFLRETIRCRGQRLLKPPTGSNFHLYIVFSDVLTNPIFTKARLSVDYKLDFDKNTRWVQYLLDSNKYHVILIADLIFGTIALMVFIMTSFFKALFDKKFQLRQPFGTIPGHLLGHIFLVMMMSLGLVLYVIREIDLAASDEVPGYFFSACSSLLYVLLALISTNVIMADSLALSAVHILRVAVFLAGYSVAFVSVAFYHKLRFVPLDWNNVDALHGPLVWKVMESAWTFYPIMQIQRTLPNLVTFAVMGALLWQPHLIRGSIHVCCTYIAHCAIGIFWFRLVLQHFGVNVTDIVNPAASFLKENWKAFCQVFKRAAIRIKTIKWTSTPSDTVYSHKMYGAEVLRDNDDDNTRTKGQKNDTNIYHEIPDNISELTTAADATEGRQGCYDEMSSEDCSMGGDQVWVTEKGDDATGGRVRSNINEGKEHSDDSFGDTETGAEGHAYGDGALLIHAPFWSNTDFNSWRNEKKQCSRILRVLHCVLPKKYKKKHTANPGTSVTFNRRNVFRQWFSKK